MLDVRKSTEIFVPAEARTEFSLTSADLLLLHQELPEIFKEIANPIQNKIPPIGATWQRTIEFYLKREGAVSVPVTIKKPRPSIDTTQLFQRITRQEFELLQHGFNGFAPTYPLGDLSDTKLFVQYYGVQAEPPEGMTYFDLKHTFQEYLASLGLGVTDFPNNAIYTEHGWLLFDVEDVRPINKAQYNLAP